MEFFAAFGIMVLVFILLFIVFIIGLGAGQDVERKRWQALEKEIKKSSKKPKK